MNGWIAFNVGFFSLLSVAVIVNAMWVQWIKMRQK